MAEKKETAALALAANGLQALTEETLENTIKGARSTLLTEAQTKFEEAEVALAAAEKAKDKRVIARAKIKIFEAKCRLTDIQYSQREMEVTEPGPNTQPPAQGAAGFQLAISTIHGHYPQFAEHYIRLVENGFIEPRGNGLHWKKLKQSLAEYFNAIKPDGRRHDWGLLENLFGTRDLKNSLSNNGNTFLKKLSKDFEELQKLLV